MEDTTSRSSVAALRAQFSSRIPPSDERVGASDELLSEADSTPETPSAPSRRRKQAPTTSEFSGSLVPAQFKLPADLVQSLKLHAIDTGENMSEIVLRCLTTPDVLTKAWISTRKAS
jgi:hypothetical protein